MRILKKVLCMALSAVLLFTLASCSKSATMAEKQASPQKLAVMEQRERAQKQGDIYVSPSGNDQNPGTKAQPVKTIAGALELARSLEKAEKVIYLQDGEYPITAMKLTAADSGVTFFAENEAVLNGGLTLDPADFQDYKENIKVLDLSKYGVTAERIGQNTVFQENFHL